MFRVDKEIPPISPSDLAKSEKGMATPFAGTTVVVTGKLKYFTRASIHAKIESLGGRVRRTVSKNTDYLICGEKPGNKLAKAHLLGVRVLNEKEFLLMAHHEHLGSAAI